jgi:hypothetical protein
MSHMILPMEIIARARHPWALLPRKIKIDVKAKENEARLMEENFRLIRQSQSAEFCWPWRLGQEIGWVVDAPVSVSMDALNDIQLDCPDPNESPPTVTKALFTRHAGWMRLYEYRENGRWLSMFMPLGQGAVEWLVGWDLTIPSGYFVMLLPYEPIQNLEVVVGLLDHKNLERMRATNGVPIAVRPRGPVTIRRGQPIVKIILLHPDSSRAKMSVEGEPSAGEQAGAQP